MIDLSKRRFKKIKKITLFYFLKKYLNSKKFDYVISSGLFNVKNNFRIKNGRLTFLK